MIAAIAATACACSRPEPPTGAVWTFQTTRPWLAGESQAMTPAVDSEAAYFCGGYSLDDRAAIHAISLADGSVRWERTVANCRGPAMLFDGTVVVISAQDEGSRCVIEGYGHADGRTRWRHEYDSRDCAPSATQLETSLVAGGDGDQILRLRAADGHRTPFDLGGRQAPDDQIWVASSHGTAWFGIGTRAWRWADDADQPLPAFELSESAGSAEHAVVAGRMLVLGDRRPGLLRGFDLESGTLLWQQSAFPQVLAVEAAAERLFATIWRRRFELVEIDSGNGIERWAARDGGFYPPTLTSDGLIAANGEFSVFVADPSSGRILHVVESAEEVTTKPVQAGDLLLFGTISGALHAVRTPRVGP